MSVDSREFSVDLIKTPAPFQLVISPNEVKSLLNSGPQNRVRIPRVAACPLAENPCRVSLRPA